MAATSSAAFIKRLFDINWRLSTQFEQRLGVPTDRPFWDHFHRTVVDAVAALPEGATFVDLGGGRGCDYLHSAPGQRPFRLVSVDISAEELAHNHDADERIVADVTEGLPFGDGQVDLLVSRTLLEHVADVPAAVGHIARVLRPTGRTIHLVPGRNSLFALAARLLPFGLVLRLLHFARPEAAESVRFEVHYDRTDPVAMKRLLVDAGLRNVQVEWTPCQADYFKSVFPLYVLVVLYEAVVRRLGLSRLAAYLIVSAEGR